MKRIFLLIMVIVELILNCIVYSDSVTNELSDNLLRLHIIANSNSETDQKIKLEVRDKIINRIGNIKAENKEEVIESVNELKMMVDKFLNKHGIDYCCNIIHTEDAFPTKIYNNISIPEGNYECLKVVLGKGYGENWWCVAYPPLCFTEEVVGKISGEGDERLKNILCDEAYNIIKNENKEYKVKFLAIEIINKFISKI